MRKNSGYQGLSGGGHGELLINEYRIQFGMMKNFCSRQWWWRHNNVLKCTLRMVKILHFCVFYHNKKVPEKKKQILYILRKKPTAGSYMFLLPQQTAHNTSEILLDSLPTPTSNLIVFQQVACSVLPWPMARNLFKNPYSFKCYYENIHDIRK